MEIINGNDREIDVEKIMATVRERLERQRARGPSETEGHEVSSIESPGSPPGLALIEPLGHYLTMLNRLRDPKPQGVIAAGGSALKERAKRWLRQVLAPYHRAIFVRQETFNTHLIELLNRLLPAVSHEIGPAQALEEYKTRHNYLKDRLTEAWTRIESLRIEYDQAISQSYTQIEKQIQAGVEKDKLVSSQFEALRHQLSGLDTHFEELEKVDGELRNAHVELYRQVDEIKRDNLLQIRRLDLVLTELRRKAGLEKKSLKLFEVKHRGSREEIKKRQEIYLPLFRSKLATIERGMDGSTNPVLDVECGRGELLDLLREHGIPARGIDLSEEMVQFCRDRDLGVEQVGAIPYLRAREDDSLRGVIARQVIEHFPTEELIEFLKLCHQKVMKGGLVVLETVNPTSALVSATSFYVDLSHVRQIHPLSLQFLVEALGFLKPEVRFLSPYPDEIKLQLLANHAQETQVLNRNFEKLNELLFGCQDFALICEK